MPTAAHRKPEHHKRPLIVLADRNVVCVQTWSEWLRSADVDVVVDNTPSAHADAAAFVIGASIGLAYVRALPRVGRAIIFVADDSSEALAIEALRSGCTDYLKGPIVAGDLIHALRHVAASAPVAPGGIVGDSAAMRDLRAVVTRMAHVRSNVLITGETGTGKELVARAIHQQSERASRSLVCVNCAAIPDTLVESELFGFERGAFTGATTASAGKLREAHAGTIFFDEIGEMSPYAQAKILRVVDTREVCPLGGRRPAAIDVRIVSATHRDLEAMVAAGQFRHDLLFRLNVARIHVPPLRDRPGDVPALARHYIADLNAQFGAGVEDCSDETWESLVRHPWPGNVRELKNVLESIFVHSAPKVIGADALPPYIRAAAHSGGGSERDRLLAALLATRWNKTKAAEQLRWSRMTLYRKMAKYSVHHS